MSHHEDTELRLGLPGTNTEAKKRVFSDVNKESTHHVNECGDEFGPPKKVQAIGWPPVRSFRKNCIQAIKEQHEKATSPYVKVSMDGAPYLRKIDLSVCRGYKDLLKALGDMFQLKADVLSKRSDKGSECKLTYEDKDGDWMLVGDVPWEMFISSCKKLRIMKGSEAN